MPYYSNNEDDTGYIVDEKTGAKSVMFPISITLAEYRDLVERAAKNEAARIADDYWKMRTENIALRAELADLRKKLSEVKEAEE